MKQKVFLFLSLLLTTVWGGARAAGIPQAIWCYDTQTQGGTFYFVNLEMSYHAGDTFQGKTVTAAWRGDQVSALSDSPGWQDDAYRKESLKDGDGTSYSFKVTENATKVVIDESFSSVKPIDLEAWFYMFRRLKTIEGLKNLNTSEATSIGRMFLDCRSLTELDLTNFDVSKVTEADGTFDGCESLKTIYCDKSWSFSFVPANFFYRCFKLVGGTGVSYSYGKQNAEYANPFTGYFTAMPDIDGTGTKEDPFILTTTGHWNALVNFVQSGRATADLHFALGNDINISTTVGTNTNPFKGSFDGNGHTLTASLNDNLTSYMAPFQYVQDVTIKNLQVAGYVVGGYYTSGIVGGVVDGTNTVTNCRVSAEVYGHGHAGGIVGHAHTATLRVIGCVFDGCLGDYNIVGDVAAIVGWCENEGKKVTVKDCVEAVQYFARGGNGTTALALYADPDYPNLPGQGHSFSCVNSYSINGWEGGTRLYAVKDPSGYIVKAAGAIVDDTYHYVTFYNGYISEGATDGSQCRVYAKAGAKLYFEDSGYVMAATDESGKAVDVSSVNYLTSSLIMPSSAITLKPGKCAYALYTPDNQTLTFVNIDQKIFNNNSTWNDLNISQSWSGTQVTATSKEDDAWPGWGAQALKIRDNATTVVFDKSFAEVRPTSLVGWFQNFSKLKKIEGIENLNTEEVTTMYGMFSRCNLSTVDVSSFDVSKVENTNHMFSYSNLSTIYCDDDWSSIPNSTFMFVGSTHLKNYNGNKVSGAMATPYGYFTSKTDIAGNGTRSNPYIISSTAEWNLFAKNVTAGKSYEDQYVKLTSDIDVKTMVGDEDHAFRGHFDGNGHTLTVKLSGKNYVAPFRNVDGWINNLIVKGTISASGKFAGGIVAKASYIQMENCRSEVAILSTVNGDGSTGGLVGIIVDNPSYEGYRHSIKGCAFTGKLLGGNTQQCGGFVGWMGRTMCVVTNSLFAPSEVTFKSDGSFTFIRWSNTDVTAEHLISVDNSFYTTRWGDVQGIKVNKVTDTTGKILPTTSQTTEYNVSGIALYGSDFVKFSNTSGTAQTFYVTSDKAFSFTSPVLLNGKVDNDTWNSFFEMTGDGTSASPYTFTLGAVLSLFNANVIITESSDAQAYAVWCADNKTLYFTSTNEIIYAGGTWNGMTVNAVWSGDDVTASGAYLPDWKYTVAEEVKTVEFMPSFKAVRPGSLHGWFSGCSALTDIKGIENLNTSNVAYMSKMFESCTSLKQIDVSAFDVSKIQDASFMFAGCTALTTIFCDKTWNLNGASLMFLQCSQLVGAVAYDSRYTSGSMANPIDGYFTSLTIHLVDLADNSATINKFSGKTVNVTYDRTFSAIDNGDGTWTSRAYTVCVPFDIDVYAQIGNNADVIFYQLTSVTKDREFVFYQSRYREGHVNAPNVMYAGEPYLVVVNKGTFRLEAQGVKLCSEPIDIKVIQADEERAFDEEAVTVGYWKGTFSNISNDDAAAMLAHTMSSDGCFRRITNEDERYRGAYVGTFRAFYCPLESDGYYKYTPKFLPSTEGEEDELQEFPADTYVGDNDYSEPDATGITLIRTVDNDGTHRYFDLQGRPLQSRPAKGFYIDNGEKKLIFK